MGKRCRGWRPFGPRIETGRPRVSARRRLLGGEGLEDRLLLAAPDVTTLAASAITNTSATLDASVNPNDSSTNVYLEMALDPSLAPNMVGTLLGAAGMPGSADGTSSAARFNQPEAVAVDSQGNVFIADTSNDTIREFSSGGGVTTLAGVAGQTGSADGTGAAARFNTPSGLAVDSAGNLYVADSGNHTIRKIAPGGVVTTLAGSPGHSGSADGTGAAASFNEPAGLAVDPAGNLYVADLLNQTIREITPDGVVTTLAGSAGQIGSADGTGSAARFNYPEDVALDGAGNLYVADTLNNTIREISPARVVTTVAGVAGQAGSTDGTGASARFFSPQGIVVGAAGNVFVADQVNNAIREITPGGVVTTLAGSASLMGSADGTGTSAQFNRPIGLAEDAVGNLYVADTNNDTIRELSPLTILAQSGVTGTSPVVAGGTLNGLTPGTPYYFRGLATNADGTTLGAILTFTTTGQRPVATTISATAGTSQTATAGTPFGTLLQAVVVDQYGNPVAGVEVTFAAPADGASAMFVGGQSTVMVATNSSGVATAPAFAANSTIGSYTVTASAAGIATAATFNLTNSAGDLASIQFAGAQFTVSATDATAQVILSRAGNLSATVTVVLSSPGGTDVDALQQTVTFGPNVTTVVVPIPIHNDGKAGEPDASIPLVLSAPSAGAALGASNAVNLVVHDSNPLPAPVTLRMQLVPVTITKGKGKRAKKISETGIQLVLSGPLSGAGNLAAYQVLTGKIKKGVRIYSKVVPLISAVYNPSALTVTLTPAVKLNLSQPDQLRVTTSLLTGAFGLHPAATQAGTWVANFGR